MLSGKLKKIDEPVKKDEEKKKKKKHKSNVKFTDRKSSKQVSSEDVSDDSDAALVVGSSDVYCNCCLIYTTFVLLSWYRIHLVCL